MEKNKLALWGKSFFISFEIITIILIILDYDNIVYHATINRRTFIKTFDLSFNFIPILIALLCINVLYIYIRGWKKEVFISFFPLILSLYSFNYGLLLSLISSVSIILINSDLIEEIITSTSLIIISFYIFTSIYWVLFYPLGLSSILKNLANFELIIYSLGNYITPLITVIFLFGPFISPFLKIKPTNQTNTNFWRFNSNHIFTISLILAFLSALYPHSPYVNPKNMEIGIDTQSYIDSLDFIGSEISKISEMSRPFFFLMLWMFKSLMGFNSINAVNYAPIILLPSLVFSTFYLSFQITEDKDVSSIAAFFTATGSKVVVGLYSFFLSNILGLILIQLSIGLLFNYFKKIENNKIYYSSSMLALSYFSHDWTFFNYIIPIFLSLIALYYNNKLEINRKSILKVLVTYFIIVITIIFIQYFLSYQNTSSVGDFINVFSRFNASNGFWYGIIFSLRLQFGGFLSIPLILVLATLGVLIHNDSSLKKYYFMMFNVFTLIIFMISDEGIKSRLYYNIPIEIYASIGFIYITTNYKKYNKMFFKLTFFYCLTFLFRSLANIV